MPKPRRKFGPSQKDRIFLALLPDAQTAARIHALAEALKAKHGFTANLILPEHLHVTLFHLGDWAALPQMVIDAAKTAAESIAHAPFDAVFDTARSFRNSTGIYPFVLTGPAHGAPLHGFHKMLGAALKKAGLGAAVHEEDFTPHVTLTYDAVKVKPGKLDAPTVWTVRDFVLVHSQLGRTTHHHLARFALQDQP
ncbi:MAG TPA: 2'-5' RNA ligase family protein [Rhizomicrobium sp.]|jgi:2'-5' RNA ligase|nr:2'-5' RNA ligase family protein [Rhizomicrobium sp.]